MYRRRKGYFDQILTAGLPEINPFGAVFYVDPANGSDANDGKAPETAFASLNVGLAALTANKNDTLVLVGNETSTAKLVATLDWDKDYTHLIGVCAPVSLGQRARIFGHADNENVTPLIKVSAKGCSFRNIYVNYGVDDAGCLVAVEVTGSRNYFENCHFSGINHATQDAAGACSLKLNGCAENRFKHCSIGSDTQHTRGAANSEILVDDRASKQFFEDCYIYAWISAAGHSLVRSADEKGMVGTWMFKNCLFQSMFLDNATAMTSAFSLTSLGGIETLYIILDHCIGVHIGAWDSNSRTKTYVGSIPAAVATDGLAEVL